MAISIIMTHWAMNKFRSEILKVSLNSLIETTKHLPVEIFVIDNGNNMEDSKFLLDLVHSKKIQYYIRNSENLYFGYGRNQGVDLSCGEYLAFSDNDIKYKPGWLEKCIRILEDYPERKLMATPLRTDRQHRQEKYWRGTLESGGRIWLLNDRAGSNCWVMRRKDFEIIGRFRNHHIAGSHWLDASFNKGYTVATLEKEPLAEDIGFKRGYNIKLKAQIKKVFANGEELVINN